MIAQANASDASSGLGVVERLRILVTMYWICFLSA